MANRLSLKSAKRIGSIYFLLLGLINLTATFIMADVHALDLITAGVCMLPIIIRNKAFVTMFGLITALISVYFFFAALSFSLEPNTQTTWFAYAMGFLFIGSTLTASIMLLYSGKGESKQAETSFA